MFVKWFWLEVAHWCKQPTFVFLNIILVLFVIAPKELMIRGYGNLDLVFPEITKTVWSRTSLLSVLLQSYLIYFGCLREHTSNFIHILKSLKYNPTELFVGKFLAFNFLGLIPFLIVTLLEILGVSDSMPKIQAHLLLQFLIFLGLVLSNVFNVTSFLYAILVITKKNVLVLIATAVILVASILNYFLINSLAFPYILLGLDPILLTPLDWQVLHNFSELPKVLIDGIILNRIFWIHISLLGLLVSIKQIK